MSSDRRHIALTRSTNFDFNPRDIWVLDLTQHTQSRVSFDSTASGPVWSPDGKRIAYTTFATGRTSVKIVPADGSGAPQVLLMQTGLWKLASFEPGGRGLVFYGSPVQEAKQSIWRVSLDSGSTPQQILASPFDNASPSLSPNGKWLAYMTNESGRPEVYVRSYPGPGGRWQVSMDGGTEPVWSPVGNEIFYRNADVVMAAVVRTQPTFEVTSRTKLFTGEYALGGQNYEIMPDGKSFVMLRAVTGPQQAIVVTLNLFDELRRKK
jgi:Tol biopolymer transport system component